MATKSKLRGYKMRKKLQFCALLGFVFFAAASVLSAWTGPTRLTWSARNSWAQDMAIGNGIHSNNIHIVYVENLGGGNYEVYYKNSTDYGATWNSPVRLTWAAGYSTTPRIALGSSQNIYVVYADDRTGKTLVYFKKSTDGGSNWSASTALATLDSCFSPDIAVQSSGATTYIHVVMTWWGGSRGYDIVHKRSTTEGDSWTSLNLVGQMDTNSSFPSIAADSLGNLHVAWVENVNSNNEIYYRKNTSYGGYSSWTTAERITWNSGNSIDPYITVDPSNNVYLAWSDNNFGAYDILFKKKGPTTPWGIIYRLTYTTGDARRPNLCVYETLKVHLAFYDDTRNSNDEIYYNYSSDGGNNWGILQRLTWTNAESINPILGVDYTNKDTHLIYCDKIFRNYHEVIYKKD